MFGCLNVNIKFRAPNLNIKCTAPNLNIRLSALYVSRWGLVCSYDPRTLQVRLFGSGVTKRGLLASPTAQELVRTDRFGPRFDRGKRHLWTLVRTRAVPVCIEMAGSGIDPAAVLYYHLWRSILTRLYGCEYAER